jgi:phosphatidylglycerol---prolipoprotein diacylglyceryl transferase
VLFWIERRFRDRLRQGDLLLVYLILYPVGRFLLDFVRLDSNGFGPLTTAQLVALLVAVIATAALVFRHRQPLSPPVRQSARNVRDKST